MNLNKLRRHEKRHGISFFCLIKDIQGYAPPVQEGERMLQGQSDLLVPNQLVFRVHEKFVRKTCLLFIRHGATAILYEYS